MKDPDLQKIAVTINQEHGLLVSVTKLAKSIAETKSTDPAILAAHIRAGLEKARQRILRDEHYEGWN